MPDPTRRRFTAALALLAAAGLTGCGFRLRDSLALPYDSLYLALPEQSELGVQLRRAVRTSGSTRLTETAAEAQAILTPTIERRDKSVLSFNSAGRVREFQLRYQFNYRLHDGKGRDLAEPASIALTRDVSFDDAAVLAKEQEEALLWRDMEKDLVQQILRRLAAGRPPRAAGG